MKNNIIEKDEYFVMILRRRKGEDFEVKLDKKGIDKLKDYPYSWHAHYNKTNYSYYARATVYQGIVDGKPKYKGIYLHRYLMDMEEHEDVDHINHNTLDNRYSNLRLVDRGENSRHRKGKNKNNTTGVRNVSYAKGIGKYIVQLQVNGKNTKFGEFDDLEEARKCAEENRKKYYPKTEITK